MKAETLMVLWHSKEPVFSVDFHPSGRLASSGADNDIKVITIIIINHILYNNLFILIIKGINLRGEY